MKTRQRWASGIIGVLLVMLFFAVQAPGGVTRSLSVRRFSPEGLVKGSVQIRVDFSGPVVSKDVVGKSLGYENFPISFSPSLPGNGIWANEKSFVYEGTPNGATSYKASIKDNLTDEKGNRVTGKLEYEFHTAPLSVKSMRQVEFDRDFTYYQIDFSLPVRPSRLLGFISASDSSGPVPVVIQGDTLTTKPVVRVSAGNGSPVNITVLKGMTSDTGPLGLSKDVSFKLERKQTLSIQFAEAGSDIDGSFIRVITNTQLHPIKSRPFISLSGLVDAEIRNIEYFGSSIIIRGFFGPRDRVTLKLAKGLPSTGDLKLESDWERSFVVGDIEPDIRFDVAGRFISPLGGEFILPLRTINIEKVRLTLDRIYDNSVTVAMLRDWPSYFNNFTESILNEEYTVGGELNEVTERGIDLKAITGGRRGIFLITAANTKSWQDVSRVINITDIGGSARLGKRDIAVWATSLENGTPLKGVDVTLWSDNNQQLAAGKTDSSGVWQHNNGEQWNPSLRPDFALLKQGEDVCVLRFDSNIWDLADYDRAGAQYNSGYEAICFSPRGVYRPGEKVPLKFLLRNRSLAATSPFPVKVSIITPNSREWRSYTRMLSDQGIGDLLLDLPPQVPLGTWRAEIYIPGDESPVGGMFFAVEDISPPRIAVKTKLDKNSFIGPGNIKLSIAANYLFGSPADGLVFENEIIVSATTFTHKDWPGYLFSDERLKWETETVNAGSGTLSQKGEGTVNIVAEDANPPSMLNLQIRTSVMEDGGRWVHDQVTASWFKKPLLLGIEEQTEPLKIGTPTTFRVAAVTPEGKPAKVGQLKAKLYEVVDVPQIFEGSNGTDSERREEFVDVEEKTLQMSSGRGEVAFSVTGQGSYLIAVEDPESGVTASHRFYASTSRWVGDGTGGLPNGLEISFNKEQYKPGERAEINVKGDFDGSLLLTVETDEVLHMETSKLVKGRAKLSFKVTESMFPNAWVTAQVVRPVKPSEQWTAHRASGIAPISLDCTPSRLEVNLTVPEQLRPRAKNEFSLTLKDSKGKGVAGEVVLMLVDEGVLGLTGYKTPRPYDFFTARRGHYLSAFDIYSSLIQKKTKSPPLLSAGGGEGEENTLLQGDLTAHASPVRGNRFKILTLHKRVKTDSSGKANFSFVLPEFSGTARLMAVAASKKAFGTADEKFIIARPIVSELYLPRALAPGDSFAGLLHIFNRTNEKQKVSYEISIEGPLKAKNTSGSVTLVPGESDTAMLNIPFEADAESGLSKVKLVTKSTVGGSTQTIELPVRPAYPRISQTGFFSLKPGESKKQVLPNNWMNGTRRASIVTSSYPQAQLTDLTTLLINYPYGCLEQTVSYGWALLATPQLAQGVAPSLADPRQVRMELGEKLRAIQAMQLYHGAFSNWPGTEALVRDYWNSIYATHFIVACKEAGVSVSPTLLNSALGNLRQMIAIAPGLFNEERFSAELDARAYVSYVLAQEGSAPLAWMNYLKDNSDSMTDSGRLLLSSAYSRAGEKETGRDLLQGVKKPGEIYIPSLYEEDNLNSNLRTLALRLIAWLEIDPSSAEAAAGANELLMALRNTETPTTQEGGFSLAALSTYFKHNQETGKAKITTTPNILKDAKEGDALLRTVIDDKMTSITFKNEGDGRGFVSWSVDGVPLEAPKAEDRGLKARVEFLDSQGKPLDLQNVRRGAKIVAKFTVDSTNDELRNLVIVQPLPSGIESENPRLNEDNTERNAAPIRTEARDDRLIFFIERLGKERSWSVTLRAVTMGEFVLPPLAAEGMYSPGVRSITSPGRIKVTER